MRIEDYIAQLGLTPDTVSGNDGWYFGPDGLRWFKTPNYAPTPENVLQGDDGQFYVYDEWTGLTPYERQISGYNLQRQGDSLGAGDPVAQFDASGMMTGSTPYDPGPRGSGLGDILSMAGDWAKGGGWMFALPFAANAAMGGSGFLQSAGAAGADAGIGGFSMTAADALPAVSGAAEAGAAWLPADLASMNAIGGSAFTGAVAPMVAGAGGASLLSQIGNGVKDLVSSIPGGLGTVATVAGGLLGSQGQEKTTTESKSLDPALAGAAYGDLVPRTMGLLGDQFPSVTQAGNQMANTGMGLLSNPVAGNGYGQINFQMPDYGNNPYVQGVLSDMERRHKDFLDKSLLGIKSNFVAAGGVGNERQRIAEAEAIKGAADNFTGQMSGFLANLYNSDMNRSLSRYGTDASFYQGQRGQDMQSAGLGGDLMSAGYGLPWQSLKGAASVFQPFTGATSATSTTNTGGGWGGAVGGLLGGANLANKMGLWPK